MFDQAESKGGQLDREDYEITIRSKWGSFYAAPSGCKSDELNVDPDGSIRYDCTIVTDDLKKSPFSLSVGDLIIARVVAKNQFGLGPYGESYDEFIEPCSGIAIIKGCPSEPTRPRTLWQEPDNADTYLDFRW